MRFDTLIIIACFYYTNSNTLVVLLSVVSHPLRYEHQNCRFTAPELLLRPLFLYLPISPDVEGNSSIEHLIQMDVCYDLHYRENLYNLGQLWSQNKALFLCKDL